MTKFYRQVAFIVSFIFILNILNAQSVKYEAENAVLSGGLKIEKSYQGFSGSGYVGRFENSGDLLTITFSLDQAAIFNIYIGYLGPFGNKINFLGVNGNKIEISFPSTNQFREVPAGKIGLRSGSNEIIISKSWGWFYVDYLRIEKNSEPGTEFNISTQLVTPQATRETLSLYKFLTDNFKKKIISGVMTLNSFDESNWLKQKTGKEPALLGIDFMHTNRGYVWYDNNTPVNDARIWYSRNGIPAMMWHWRDPSRKTEEFYSDKTTFDVSKINDTNSPEYKAMVTDIDFIANLLKVLQDQTVPVLWRPLHEASGAWFWWGAKGPEPVKSLWRLMFDRMVNYHGLKNMIWVWTTDTKSDNLDWYPGDAYVDILGVDIYAEKGDLSSQILQFNKVRDDFKGKKMVALSENGIIPKVDNLIEDKAYWSWFMVWYGDFVEDGIKNSLISWQNVMNHEYVVTLDEMPLLSKYLGVSPAKLVSENGKFKLALNKRNKSLTIEYNEINKPFNAFMFDLNGRLLQSAENKQESVRFPLNDFKPGIYIIKLIYGNDVETVKIAF